MRPIREGGQAATSAPAWQLLSRAHYAVVLLIILAAACGNVVAQEAKYLAIYEKIGQADSLETEGKTAAAMAKYIEAHTELTQLRTADPSWNREMVSYRLNYLAEKVAACQAKLQAAAAAASSSTNAQNATADKSATKGTAQARQPNFKLLEPGSEPRKALRYQPKPGDTQTVGFTMKMALEPGPLTNFPPIEQTVQVTIKNVSANGDVEYEMSITDVSVTATPDTPAQLLEKVKEAFSYAKGLTTAGLISGRGFGKKTEMKSLKPDKPPAAVARLFQAQMTRGLDIVAMPLPEEPVGAGGKWEVEQDSGDAVEKTTYEIVSLAENRVTAKATITVSPATQKTSGPAMSGGGNGEVTVDLAHIMPEKGSLVYSVSGTAAGGGTQKQPVNIRTRMELRIEPK